VVKAAVCHCVARGSGPGAKGAENETPYASRGEEWGGARWYPLPIRLRGLRERRELPSGVRGGAPAENEFGAFLPARRYASAGLCDSDVSVRPYVCPSVCHTPVLCLAERKQDREMCTI